MRVTIKNEILFFCVLPLALNVMGLLTGLSFLHSVSGSFFTLFSIGYVFLAVLFPEIKTLGMFERIFLSLVISTIVGVLIGFLLNYTPKGITLDSLLTMKILLLVTLSVTAWYRRKNLPVDKRFVITFEIPHEFWPKGKPLDKVLTIILLLTGAMAFGLLSYNIINPPINEKFTEFYMLGEEGIATDYPLDLSEGSKGKVIVGIVNHEQKVQTYYLELKVNGSRQGDLIKIPDIEHGEKWEKEMSFVFEKAGKIYLVEFILYKEENSDAYQRLYLWVNAKP